MQQDDGVPEHSQESSTVQSAAQPSCGLPAWLPSSHSSPASTVPLPQHAGIGFPRVHSPNVQVSSTVHELPSSHGVPSRFHGSSHNPREQPPGSWHWSSAVQTTPSHSSSLQGSHVISHSSVVRL